jgi:hypothetical protein
VYGVYFNETRQLEKMITITIDYDAEKTIIIITKGEEIMKN